MSENGLVAAIENPETNECGTQFHFETTDITEHGAAFISNFLDKAGIERDFTPEDREEQAIAYIREQVGDKKVLCLVSGWVDSTVLARLLAKALKPEQLLLVHVDNGFMREGESSEVVEEFEKIKMKVEVILAQQEFANATTEIDWVEVGPLKETIDPEHKRKIIGDTFMRITDQKILKLVEEKWWKIDDVMIAQWTLRPDLIESASKMVSGKATTIKTHHNDTPLVRQKREAGMILEPLKDFHKDEVRELWERLGLFRKLVWRQPFPGPWLAIRMICAAEAFIWKTFDSTNELLTQLTNYDRTEYEWRNNIFSNLFTGWKRKINRFVKGNLNTEATKEMLESIAWNINATLLPIKTVWVQGDGRTYSYAATLSGEKDWDKLQYLAKAIPSLSHDINRVVYELWEEDKIVDDVTEITPTYPTEKPIEKVRKATKVVDDVLEKYDLMEKLAQVPVVLVPLPFGKEWNHSIVIRTFMTETFMVGRPAIPWKDIPEEALQEMYEGIMEIPGISKVFYDLTGKPPATTEWE